jgi:DNA (cytosine-5)-methyltransferase 1
MSNYFNSNGGKMYKTVDLFAGIGGIRLGFEKTGYFETVYANDFEPNCKITYDLNFDKVKLDVRDIREVNSNELPSYDLLLAGFPCQPFSIAGRRQGFEDKKGRGNLFFEIERILKETKPKGFLLENVKNLESHDKGNTFKVIKETLEDLGYKLKYKVLNTMEHGGIPQNRERIYIVGFMNENTINNFKFPRKKPLKKEIKDMLDEEVKNKYHYNDKPLFNRIKDDITREDTVYQWRRKYIRENKSGVFPTLTANMGTGGHNVPIIRQGEIIRKITPKECANVQGFPSDFKIPEDLADSHLYKQLGNSVSIPVIERIAINMYKALQS